MIESIDINDNGFWDHNGHALENHFNDLFVAELLVSFAKKYSPSLVYDFGCGTGFYLKQINDTLGIESIGFEGVPDTALYQNILKKDLTEELTMKRSADMSISLEVGEHIPKEFEQIFIDNICNNTNKILVLSWAIKGQGGKGHVNCQDNDYIIEEVEKRGFKFNPKILNYRKNAELRWFKNTLMMFERV